MNRDIFIVVANVMPMICQCIKIIAPASNKRQRKGHFSKFEISKPPKRTLPLEGVGQRHNYLYGTLGFEIIHTCMSI
jgi:hypothetical protein